MKNKRWIPVSLGLILLSIISLFFPVITYTSARTGITEHYNIIGFFRNGSLVNTVFSEYHGMFLRSVSDKSVSVLLVVFSVIGVGAIVMSFFGIRSMAIQKESDRPYRLTMLGLIVTALIAMALLTLFLFSLNHFEGTMHLGAYLIVTPIAMLFACITVSRRHKLSVEEIRTQKAAEAYIHPARDLPPLFPEVQQ